MILKTLRSFPEVPPESMSVLDPKDKVRPGETVLGTMSRLQTGLFVVLLAEIKELKRKHAATFSARSKAALEITDENLDLVESADRELDATAERFNAMSLLFRLELVEEFEIDDGFAVGIREGFKVVKYPQSEVLGVGVFRFTHSSDL